MAASQNDAMAKAKRLMAKMKQSKLHTAYTAWKELCEFEQTVQTVEDVVGPLAAVFDKKPSDRTSRDVQRLVPVIAQIKAYNGLAPPVLEFLATYATLDIIWDTVEMPRSPSDSNSLFSVISGGVKAVVADTVDPQLLAMARMSAAQLMDAMQEEKMVSREASCVALPEASAKQPESINRLGLGSKYNDKKVTTKLWRTMIELMHNGRMPSRAAAAAFLASQAVPTTSISGSGSDKAGSGATGRSPVPRASAAGGPSPRPLPVFTGVGPSLVEVHVRDSFSGRDMECRSDVGLVENLVQEIPPKVQGAVGVDNTVTALLVMSRAAYRRAMMMQQEISIRKAVDSCCRLPFLRHTPLKELFKLSKHLTTSHFSKGDVLLTQGKENTTVYFLLEGEVELVVDVPVTSDRDVLLNSLMSLAGKNTSSHRLSAGLEEAATAPRVSMGTLESESERGTRSIHGSLYPSPRVGSMQRVVLGRRGPGVILGDDSIREKYLVLTVVAVSPHVVALATSSQRFVASLDPLTQRLFNKLRIQHSATSDLGRAITDVGLRQQLTDRCRSQVLAQSYEGPRGLPGTLQRDPDWGKQRKLWKAGESQALFSSPVSLEAGEREAAQQADRGQRRSSATAEASEGDMALLNAMATGMPSGVKVSMFKDLPSGESLNRFLQVVKGVEDQRVTDNSAVKHKNSQADHDLLNCDASIVSKLDMSDMIGSSSVHQQYTDMIEAACLAIIQVGPLPGQSAVGNDILAPVLDDAIVSWSQLAHRHGLHLVRWSSHEYYLLGGLNPGGQKRPLVRIVANTLLEMKDMFYHNMGQSEVPHFYFSSSLVIGAVFCSYDCGRFLTGVSGHAFAAGSRLCAQVRESYPCGAILVSDAVMQSILRTHELEFAGGGYLLLGKVSLPYGASFEDLLGKGVLEKEPITSGNPKAGLYRIQAEKSSYTSHYGDSGAEYSLDDGFGTVQTAKTYSHLSNVIPPGALKSSAESPFSQVALGAPSPSAGSLTKVLNHRTSWAKDPVPLSPQAAGPGATQEHSSSLKPAAYRLGPLVLPAHEQPRHGSPAAHNSPWGLPAAAHSPQSMPQKLRASLGTDDDVQQSPVRTLRPSTLEPNLVLTRTTKKREQIATKSAMDFREQLRREVMDLRGARQHVEPRAKPDHAFAATKRSASVGGAGVGHVPSNLHLHLHDVVNQPVIHTITPYHPGTPLADVSARKRSAQMLFGTTEEAVDGTAGSSGAARMRTPDRKISLGAGDVPRVLSPLRASLAGSNLAPRRSTDADSPAQGSPNRLRSPGPNMSRMSGSPPYESVRSPSLHPVSPTPAHDVTASSRWQSSSPTSGRPGSSRAQGRPCSGGSGRPGSRGVANGTVATNFGPVAIPSLDLSEPRTPAGATSSTPAEGRPGSRAATAGGSTVGGGRPSSPEGRPASRGSSLATDIGRSKQVDGPTGLTALAIHRQAVTTWKDLGSLRAAEEYVQHLNPGLINVSFSTAGLTSLPDMARLPYLDSLAASFNLLGSLAQSSQLATLTPHIKVLNLSHSNITDLPENLGQMLPYLMELNVSSNELTELPYSICACHKLIALSFEYNHVLELPAGLSQLETLQMLYASHNEVEALPDYMFETMPQLQMLDLSYNMLDRLPSSLTRLTRLQTLIASGNELQYLPPDLLSSLTALTRLELASNGLFQCTQVTGLDAEELERFNSYYNSAVWAEEEEEEEELQEPPRLGLGRAGSMRSSSMRLSMRRSMSRKLSRAASSKEAQLGEPATPSREAPSGEPAAERTLRGNPDTPRKSMTVRLLDPAEPPRASAESVDVLAGIVVPAAPQPQPQLEAAASDKAPQQQALAASANAAAPAPAQALAAEPSRSPCDAAVAAAGLPGSNLLPRLKVLDLSSNSLLAFPPWLPTGLSALYLARNQIVSIKDWVALRLTGLQLLDLHGNKIVDVSKELTRLTKLQMGALQENPCTEVEAAGAAGGAGAGGNSTAWLDQHIERIKYQAKVNTMTTAAAVV